VIDPDRGGGMRDKHHYQAGFDFGFGDRIADVSRDVNDFKLSFSINCNLFY